MRPRWHKILTDLWGNRTRSLLVIASITIGLFAIGVIATLHAVMSADMRNGYQAIDPPNVFISTGGFDHAVVKAMLRVDGVRQTMGLRAFDLRLQTGPGELTAIDLVAVQDYSAWEMGVPRLVEGVWPPGRREIVVEQYKLPGLNVQVGDWVTLELPGGQLRQLQLVGVVQDQTIGAGGGGTGGFFTANAQGFVHFDSLEALGQPELFNRLWLTVDQPAAEQDRDSLQEVAGRVSDTMKNAGVLVFDVSTRPSWDHPNRNLTDAIVGVLVVLGLLVVFLSAFLITNTLQALLDQQVQQIGIMKTIGGRRRQIAGIYFALIFIFGLLAFALAAPLAHRTSFWLMDFLAGKINIVLQGERIEPSVLVIQAVLALLVPQVAAYLPIRQGTRISVQEALSGIRQSSPPATGWLDRRIMRLRHLSRPMLISIRNTFRRKGRLLLTLTTLTLGGAIFIATFNVQVSMQNYIELITHYFLADVNITLDRPQRLSKMQGLLAQVPGVQSVEGWVGTYVELIEGDRTGQGMLLLAPPLESPLIEPVVLEGRWLQPGDRNAITLNDHFRSTYPHIKVGDTLRLRINGREREWEVVGFFQFAGKVSGLVAYTGYEYLSEITGQANQASMYRIVASQTDLDLQGQAALARQVEAHLAARGLRLRDVTTGFDLSVTAADGFNVLTAFLLFMAVLTALVGSIGLAGTMSMNVMERTREIGVMRAIGASNRILMSMVIVEGVLIGLMSWLLSSLLAFPISKVMADSISLSLFDSPSSLGFTPTGFVIWLVLVVILSILASVMPARNAARLTIREVLAYE